MNKTHQKALEAAVSHGFRKGDIVSLGHAIIGECEQRLHNEERLSKEVVELARKLTAVTGRDLTNFSNYRVETEAKIAANTTELQALKNQLAGDEDGVLRIQNLYVG